MHVRMCACVHVRMCACVHVRMCACVHARTCACTSACSSPSLSLELVPQREVPPYELGRLLQHHLTQVRCHHLLPVTRGGKAAREQPRAAAQVEKTARGGGGEETVSDEGRLGREKGREGEQGGGVGRGRVEDTK